MKKFETIISNILSDLSIELKDEFDKNFERQAFFSEKWSRTKSPLRRGKHILADTGNLRSSIRAETSDKSVRFFTDLPYAEIHNDGGEIVVTKRMKKFFWWKYSTVVGGLGRKKNGELRNNTHNRGLSNVAAFYKAMALKPEGSTITIPRRRFIGYSKDVENVITEIVEDNLNEYFKTLEL